MTNPFAAIPSVDRLLQTSAATGLIDTYGRTAVTKALRDSVSQWRETLAHQQQDQAVASRSDRTTTQVSLSESPVAQLLDEATRILATRFEPSLRPVVNLTGVVIHTNLGRSPYPEEAIQAMSRVASGNSNLEFDLLTGQRGERDSHVVRWVCELTGAEDALVVNNNAAAVMLCLNTLALDRKVLVSRGELIEIGGSFRMPEIMRQSGTRLKEVGTTNRTHLRDFESAITKKTAAIMKVHTSNYEVKGFTTGVETQALAALAARYDLPFIDDLGSGNLVDLEALGLPAERTVSDALNEGASVVTFSGDKLLGGPQCGIIAGNADIVARLKKNPMKRALRLDKITLSALEAVLRLYATPEKLTGRLPVLAMLTRTESQIKDDADRLAAVMSDTTAPHYSITVEPCESEIGSGALPTRRLKSWACVCRPDESETKNVVSRVEALSERLRRLPLPIVGRLNQGALWLDCRTLPDDEAVTSQLSVLRNTQVADR